MSLLIDFPLRFSIINNKRAASRKQTSDKKKKKRNFGYGNISNWRLIPAQVPPLSHTLYLFLCLCLFLFLSPCLSVCLSLSLSLSICEFFSTKPSGFTVIIPNNERKEAWTVCSKEGRCYTTSVLRSPSKLGLFSV